MFLLAEVIYLVYDYVRRIIVITIGYCGNLKDFNPKPPTSKEAISLRDGLFFASSRTYGESYMEPLIRKIFNYTKPETSDYDAEDLIKNETFELKSAKVMKPKLNKSQCLFERISSEAAYSPIKRIVKFKNRKIDHYDANIQNVKRDHFDYLIYILLFDEGIEIFKIKKEDINTNGVKNWSDKHGRYDELGKSGQFNIKNNTISDHESKYFERFVTYEDLVRIAKSI